MSYIYPNNNNYSNSVKKNFYHPNYGNINSTNTFVNNSLYKSVNPNLTASYQYNNSSTNFAHTMGNSFHRNENNLFHTQNNFYDNKESPQKKPQIYTYEKNDKLLKNKIEDKSEIKTKYF